MVHHKNRNVRNIFLLLGLFIIVLTSLRLCWMIYHKKPDSPLAEKGIIDLSKWDFTDKQSILLDGQWEFYPNEFIDPFFGASNKSNHENYYTSIPENWNSYFKSNQTFNFGSYYLKVKLPNSDYQYYGIQIKDILSAVKVYADGQLVIQGNEPEQFAQKHKGKLGTYQGTFYADTQEVELVIHVANNDLDRKSTRLNSSHV